MSSEDNPRASYSTTDSLLSDDILPDDVEITEGGWICYVEEFEKDVNSSGGNQFRHARKRDASAFTNWRSSDSPTQNAFDSDQLGKNVAKSVISFFHYFFRKNSRGDDPWLEAYIKIKSPLILKVLCENVKYDKSLHNDELILHEPFQPLWYQFHALDTYTKDLGNPKDSRTHINVLLDFLRSYDMPNVPELLALCDPDRDLEAISFPILWYLFAPGTFVTTTEPDTSHQQTYLVDNAIPPSRQIGKDGQTTYGNLEIKCKFLECDHGPPRFRTLTKSITPYNGMIPLQELSLVPLDLVRDHEERKRTFISRGRRFWDLRGQHMKEFINRSQPAQSLGDNERIMVDYVTYLSQRPIEPPVPPAPPPPAPMFPIPHHGPPVLPSFSGDQSIKSWAGRRIVDPRSILPRGGEEPCDQVLILCSYFVQGFSFRTKYWRQFHVDDLTDVDFQKKSFDRLVLQEDYKAVLKAMVAQHFTQGQNTFRDLVAGKGQGLNILLHGPPGVGKTLTAECIADLYERPLYSITSGDIGTDPNEAEGRLHDIFHYATIWNAVLLLDEADVFLAERDLENLTRNALVSVFLRNLEYFNGVFFLTTNRVGTVDEAFQSRLHITLGLDPLPVEDRRKIWYHFIKDLKQLSKADRQALARHARDNWALQEFNGRQIRNTVKTALTLARQDGVEVQARHIQVVLDIGMRFTSYMKRLKKMDQERVAEAIGTRLDTSANTLRIPEMPKASQSNAGDSRDALKRTRNEDTDLDWE